MVYLSFSVSEKKLVKGKNFHSNDLTYFRLSLPLIALFLLGIYHFS